LKGTENILTNRVMTYFYPVLGDVEYIEKENGLIL